MLRRADTPSIAGPPCRADIGTETSFRSAPWRTMDTSKSWSIPGVSLGGPIASAQWRKSIDESQAEYAQSLWILKSAVDELRARGSGVVGSWLHPRIYFSVLHFWVPWTWEGSSLGWWWGKISLWGKISCHLSPHPNLVRRTKFAQTIFRLGQSGPAVQSTGSRV